LYNLDHQPRASTLTPLLPFNLRYRCWVPQAPPSWRSL